MENEKFLCENTVFKDDNEFKEFLFSKKLKVNKCEICNQNPEWNSKKLNMMVYRKEKKKKNILKNIMILCPNCYSQKNIIKEKKKTNKCISCGKNFISKKKKLILDPSMELVNPNQEKIMYEQTRCNFCLKESIIDKNLGNLQYNVI